MKNDLRLFLQIKTAFREAVSRYVRFMVNPPDPFHKPIPHQTEISIDDIHRPLTSAKKNSVYFLVSIPKPLIIESDDEKRRCFILGEVRDGFKRAGFEILPPPKGKGLYPDLMFRAPFTPRTLKRIENVQNLITVKYQAQIVIDSPAGENAGMKMLSLRPIEERAVAKEVFLMKKRILTCSTQAFV